MEGVVIGSDWEGWLNYKNIVRMAEKQKEFKKWGVSVFGCFFFVFYLNNELQLYCIAL